jgi:hypothetical protein
MKLQELIWAGGALFLGVGIGAAVQTTSAQVDSCQSAGPWQVESGRSAEGHNFYAVKFNRCTGEAWVLSAEGRVADDKWLVLPNEKASPTR